MMSYRQKIFGTYRQHTYEHRASLTAEGLRKNADAHHRLVGEYLPQDKAERILEIGCGNGGFLLCCQDRGFANVSGIDISPEQVQLCREMGFAGVTCADGLAYLRDSKEDFGLIVLNDVLEHVPKDQILELLDEIYQHLRPGGRTILRVPNMSNPLNVRTRYVDFTHEAGFSTESLAQVLRVAGFDVEVVKGAFEPDRRFLFRILFDVLLFKLFVQIHRRTFHLPAEVVPGKNLIAVGKRPEGRDGS